MGRATQLAFVLRDGDDPAEDRTIVVFARDRAAARTAGARKLGLTPDEVHSCRRAPELDQYAPGPVPALALIEHNWTFYCSYCEAAVEEGSSDEDGVPHDPRPDRHDGVYCCAACEARAYADHRSVAEARAAMVELIDTKFPGALVTRVHVYGAGPLRMDPRHSLAHFQFPGSQQEATYDLSDPQHVTLASADVEAWHAWRGQPSSSPAHRP